MPKRFDQPKESILKVARTILENEGYDNLSIRYLAKKSEVSVGTIYNYFTDKNGLDNELIAGFWLDFEHSCLNIAQNPQYSCLYKLNLIHSEMAHFMVLFKSLFSQVVDNQSCKYAPKEKAVKNAMLERISTILNEAVLKDYPHLQNASPNSVQISSWLLHTIMMSTHMNFMSYEQLEPFIIKVLA